MSPEHEKVEIELARPPALAILTAERPLELLEGDEQRDGAGLGVRAPRHVERRDGVAELRLVDEAHWFSRIEPRHAGEPAARQRRERMDPRGERRTGVADVRAEPDVRPHPRSQGSASPR